MATEISPENQQYLKQVVQNGTYRDQREALDQAVELLKRRDQLRGDIQAGIDEADRGELIPAEMVYDRLEQRAEEIERRARATQ